MVITDSPWPALPSAEWADTYATLHMWTQVVGKIRLALAPPVNHWWHVTLLVTARGLTTSPMPYGLCTLEIAFDFIDHRLLFETSDGRRQSIGVRAWHEARRVADDGPGLADIGGDDRDAAGHGLGQHILEAFRHPRAGHGDIESRNQILQRYRTK